MNLERIVDGMGYLIVASVWVVIFVLGCIFAVLVLPLVVLDKVTQ